MNLSKSNKTVLFILISLLSLVVLDSNLGLLNKPAKGNWGKAVNGIQARLWSPDSKYNSLFSLEQKSGSRFKMSAKKRLPWMARHMRL